MCFYTVSHRIASAQDSLYQSQQNFGAKSNLARFTALPVAVADISLETIKPTIRIIENLVNGIIDFVGALISTKFSFDHVYECFVGREGAIPREGVPHEIKESLSAIVKAPFSLIYQIFASIKDPEHSRSIRFLCCSHSWERTVSNFIQSSCKKKLLDNTRNVNTNFDKLLQILPVTADILLSHLYRVVYMVESLALSAINLVGSPFSSRCSLSGSVYMLNDAIEELFYEMERIAMAPLDFIRAYRSKLGLNRDLRAERLIDENSLLRQELYESRRATACIPPAPVLFVAMAVVVIAGGYILYTI